ncbi:hypothetical protein [Pseudarthrobacter sp. BIM B-2242]|uniref:hypothetical protein n=1 Tax=Pseudarthrobacter sp. BIM B-2242 TaxID=2772401 RepID=UPI00168AC2D7|nr:hypothetical protein [Pseudarthrobacter sp. BIM B-2242]QOD04367.1 hypothetical protein IDT60_04715 [Pseudarthrobacter sp. BIM B-2242]
MGPFDDRDIVSGHVPGGTNTSHTIAIGHLTSLLSAVPKASGLADYEMAAVEHNVLGRATTEGRRRTFRYLRELYLLDPNRIMFRAMRDLWDEDEKAQPLLAGLSAMARDSVFRASASGLLAFDEGALVTAEMLTGLVEAAFPHAYNEGTAAKIGRNTASSWTQTGHLHGRASKTRRQVEPRPAALAFALLLGHLQGARGPSLYDTQWTAFFDADVREIEAMAGVAGQRGYIELRSGGGIVEIGFRHLLRPMEDLANE